MFRSHFKIINYHIVELKQCNLFLDCKSMDKNQISNHRTGQNRTEQIDITRQNINTHGVVKLSTKIPIMII